MEDWINLISNVGFPIFITIYLLIRLEKILNKITETLSEIRRRISKE
jgi:predicted PurR-regulated permease PerM